MSDKRHLFPPRVRLANSEDIKNFEITMIPSNDCKTNDSTRFDDNSFVVQFKKIHKAAQVPAYATEGSAGMDLRSVGFYLIAPGTVEIIDTGLAMSLPKGYEAQIRPRSGLAAKHGITVLNSPGTIDSDYRGELKVILINHDRYKPFVIEPGDRIAQMVIATVIQPQIQIAETLDVTDRGTGGLGSTGIK